MQKNSGLYFGRDFLIKKHQRTPSRVFSLKRRSFVSNVESGERDAEEVSACKAKCCAADVSGAAFSPIGTYFLGLA